MSNGKKALITIALAVLAWWLFGCGGGPELPSTPTVANDAVTVDYLEKLYATDNEEFFRNKLPKNPRIDLLEEQYMASTVCSDDGKDCVVKFNLKYVAARRVADFTILHEMCHIKTWGKDVDDFGQEIVHGKLWRSCMLQIDQRGAFREILIDNYREVM